MGGLQAGSGVPLAALSVAVSALGIAGNAAAQTAPPVNTSPPASTARAPMSAPFEPPQSFLVPPIGGIGRGRKHKTVTPADYRPVWIALHVPAHAFAVLGEGGAEVAACSDSCRFWAYAGKYELRVASAAGQDAPTIPFRIGKPGDYTVVLGDESDRDVGAALALAGSTAILIGSLVSLAGLISYDCASSTAESTSCKTPSAVYSGLITMGAGAALGSVGLVLYASNRNHVRFDGVPEPLTTRLSAAPLAHGFGLVTTLTF